MNISTPQAVRLFVGTCLALFLVCVFRIHAFSYFLLDDFNNIALIMRESARGLIVHTIDPRSDYYRPLVLLCYQLLWRCFDLHPLPYHLFAWGLHTLNVALVYLILARLVQSRYAAACGALLFAFHSCYAVVLWEIGAIFELCCGALFFLGIWTHMRFGRSPGGMALCSLVWYFAVKSKEMAITLPLVWLLSEWLVNSRPAAAASMGWRARDLARRYALPALLQLWFVHLRLQTMREWGAGDAYYMDISPRVWAAQMAWYLGCLVRPLSAADNPSAVLWLSASGLALTGLARSRNRQGLFWLVYTFVTLLPVVFLVNHRCAFFWYLPFLGLSGLFALLVRRFEALVNAHAGLGAATRIGMAAFALLAVGHYGVQSHLTRPERGWATRLSAEYRAFMTGLRGLSPPTPGETLCFRSAPPYFQDSTLESAVQVAFGRSDLHAATVDVFPPGCRYRLEFEEGRLVPITDR